MIRTKQITIVCASVALLCILCAQAFATRSASPNYATNSHEDMSLYYYGYVQCRPSYNEDGKHAQAGYIRYWRYDLLGNTVNDTGRLYTPYGTDQTDSRLLTRVTLIRIQLFRIRIRRSSDMDLSGNRTATNLFRGHCRTQLVM